MLFVHVVLKPKQFCKPEQREDNSYTLPKLKECFVINIKERKTARIRNRYNKVRYQIGKR